MQTLLNIYKPQGLTPLQTIDLVRKKIPNLAKEKIGFAGRLDPLAHGVLLLMVGEETTKEKNTYLNLPKNYEFEAVFGVTTDTYDVLGILQNENVIARSDNDEVKDPRKRAISRWPRSFTVARSDIEIFIKSKLGKQIQTYPPYSSKPVNGKPLYLWAREGKLSEIEIPSREIEIYDFKLLNVNKISTTNLQKEFTKQITSVDGDFRQNDIQKKWDDFFTKIPSQTFPTARFTISCTSGTYIRSLVNELGIKLGRGAITLEILRTKVGSYSLIDATKLI